MLDFYYERKDAELEKLVKDVLSNEKMWGQKLSDIEGLKEAVSHDLAIIRGVGALEAYKSCINAVKAVKTA